MIIRAVHNKNNPYCMVKRSTAQDQNLPARALGVLIYLMSKPDDWEPTIADICNRFPDIGKNQAYKIINEDFIRLGYARRVPERKNGKISRWVTEIYEEPDPDFGEVENPENQTKLLPENREVEISPRFPENREIKANFRLSVPENRKSPLVPENREQHNKDCLHEQNTEQQQVAENRKTAAAANPFDEPHSSRFAFFEVEQFVTETKPHIKNPGALARIIWRNGAEDKAIERWKTAREERLARQEKPKEAGAGVEIAADFSMDDWIDDLIANDWIPQLENEREEIERQGGPKLPWEQKVIAYFNNQAATSAA